MTADPGTVEVMAMLSATTPSGLLQLIQALPPQRQWAAFAAVNPALAGELTKVRTTPRHILGFDVDTAVEAVWWLRDELAVLEGVAKVENRVAVRDAFSPHLRRAGVATTSKAGAGLTPEQRTERLLARNDARHIIDTLTKGRALIAWGRVREWLLNQDEGVREEAALALVSRVSRESSDELLTVLVALACAGAGEWGPEEAFAVAGKRWRGHRAVTQGVLLHGVLDGRVLRALAAAPGVFRAELLDGLRFGNGAAEALAAHIPTLPASILAAAFQGQLVTTGQILAGWSDLDADTQAVLVGSAPSLDTMRELLTRIEAPGELWGPEVSLASVLERYAGQLSEDEKAKLLVHSSERCAATWLAAHPEDATAAVFNAWPRKRLAELISALGDLGPEADTVLVAVWERVRGALHLMLSGGRWSYRHRNRYVTEWVAAKLAAEVEDRDWALVWENISDPELTPAQVVATARALR